MVLQSGPTLAAEGEGSVDLSTAIIRVAKQNILAVVQIEVTERQEVANPLLPFESDPFFRRFLNIPKMPKKFKRELKGRSSSGVTEVTAYSPICPHLGCHYYDWNPQSKTFVCPCHGSVYSIHGKILGGPAPRPLGYVAIQGSKWHALRAMGGV